jgi:hypothetical protein
VSKIAEKPKKYEERLMESIGFDEDDLEANRAGHFTQKQIDKFAAAQKKTLNAAIFFTLLIGAVLVFLALGVSLSITALRPLLIIATLPLSLIFAALIFHIHRLRTDVHDDDIGSVEGRIDLSLQPVQNTANYFLRVEGVRLHIGKNAFLAFKNGDPYCIYYSRRAKKLLSAEWLRDNDDNLLTTPEINSTAESDAETRDSSTNDLKLRR